MGMKVVRNALNITEKPTIVVLGEVQLDEGLRFQFLREKRRNENVPLNEETKLSSLSICCSSFQSLAAVNRKV